jgi:hypothetical protein
VIGGNAHFSTPFVKVSMASRPAERVSIRDLRVVNIDVRQAHPGDKKAILPQGDHVDLYAAEDYVDTRTLDEVRMQDLRWTLIQMSDALNSYRVPFGFLDSTGKAWKLDRACLCDAVSREWIERLEDENGAVRHVVLKPRIGCPGVSRA